MQSTSTQPITLRLINSLMLASIALFFTLIAINNLIDPASNFPFVQHVLSMDTTFQHPVLMSRAITNSLLQQFAYYLIIAWQFLTAGLCWAGTFLLSKHIKSADTTYNNAKTTAYLGLLAGFLLYMVGFIIIGGEWFSMWQSTVWNGQMKAGLFINVILFVLVILRIN